MTPDKILRSSLLDIIFENRNKNYGAYSLRRNYNHRITIAVIISLIVSALISWMILTPKQKTDLGGPSWMKDSVIIRSIVLPQEMPKPDLPQPEVPEQPQEPETPMHNEASVALSTNIRLTATVDFPPPTIEQLDKLPISSINNPSG